MPTPEELMMMQQQQLQPLPQLPQMLPPPQQMPMQQQQPMPQAPPPPMTQQPMPQSTMMGMQEYWPQQQQLGFQPPPGLAPMAYPSGNIPIGGIDPALAAQVLGQGPAQGMVVDPRSQVAYLPNQDMGFDLRNPREQGEAIDWMKGMEQMKPPTGREISEALLAGGATDSGAQQDEEFGARPSPRKSRRMARAQKQVKRKTRRTARTAKRVAKQDPAKMSDKQAKEHRLERAKLAKSKMAERKSGGRRGSKVGKSVASK